MRIRAVVIASLAALTALTVIIVVASAFFIRRFDAIEADQATNKAGQALRAFEADLNQLAVSTRDHAEWDDAQSFVNTRDAAFLRANFSIDSLNGMQVDLVALLDRDGRDLYSTRVDNEVNKLLPELPGALLQIVRKLQPQVAELRAWPSYARVLQTQAGLLAFSIVEITRSDHTGATGAALFFGRFIEADEVERVRDTSQLPLVLTLIDGTHIDGSAQTPAIRQGLLAAVRNAPLQPVVDASDIAGFSLIRNWHGAPIALISVTGPRDIGMFGRRTTYYLMGSIGVLAIASVGVLLAMLSRLRRHWNHKLQMKAQQARILACLGESIVLADLRDGKIIEANDALLQTLGYRRTELRYLTLDKLFVDLPPLGELIARTASNAACECLMHGRDGRRIETEITVTSLQDEGTMLVCIVARDLTQRRQAEAVRRENLTRLAHIAEHDALTGLPNRQYLQTQFSRLPQRLSSSQGEMALICLDLDNFKNVNDSRGHGCGDQVLKIIASRLSDGVAGDDLVLRMGGDEFVVVAPLNGRAVRDIANHLLTTMREPVCIDECSIGLTASIGIAIFPQDGIDAESLLKHAEIALYQAKERGRNCYRQFADDMNLQLSEHVQIEQALRRAINTSQIQIAYQPVIDLNSGLLVSFEALTRWQHPDLGAISPARFIPVAEKSGLILELGAQVTRDVMIQLREWQDAGLRVAPVAINVAPIQFERTDFTTFVHETAMQYDIDLSLLAFEITESALMQNSSKHIVMMDTLRHAGSRVYIDDFGTGFSNLSYLKTLPVDAVKIDQAFVRNILTDASDATIVRSIVAVARQLHLDTVAEGIETAEQAAKLRELGCKLGQGYYFSKPLPATQCRSLLEQLGPARHFTETVKVRAFRQAAG